MKKQKTEQLPILVSIGDTIRKKRKELGFSQEKLAELAELHTTTISEIECGKSNLTISTIEKISISLNTPLISLMPAVYDSADKEILEIIFKIINNHRRLNTDEKIRHAELLKSISSVYSK